MKRIFLGLCCLFSFSSDAMEKKQRRIRIKEKKHVWKSFVGSTEVTKDFDETKNSQTTSSSNEGLNLNVQTQAKKTDPYDADSESGNLEDELNYYEKR